MKKIYVYKLTADNGGAPCISGGRLLSLAICKPTIRRKARCGDLIFGFAANSMKRNNALLYVARVTANLCDGEYYKSARYRRREDCVYAFKAGRFSWRKDASHHGPQHLSHDLGHYPDYPKACVLLSSDFRYFGKSGSAEYKSRYPLVAEAVETLGRGQRSLLAPQLRDELLMMAKWVWKNSKKKMGQPSSASSRGICHRAKSCAVV